MIGFEQTFVWFDGLKIKKFISISGMLQVIFLVETGVFP